MDQAPRLMNSENDLRRRGLGLMGVELSTLNCTGGYKFLGALGYE